jgi:hypothetical protein
MDNPRFDGRDCKNHRGRNDEEGEIELHSSTSFPPNGRVAKTSLEPRPHHLPFVVSLTASSHEGEDWSPMGAGRGAWFFLGVGALIGLVLGILVSVTTDVPLAPEAGVLLGALVGWLFGRVST